LLQNRSMAASAVTTAADRQSREKLCYILWARHYKTIVSRNGHPSTIHAALALQARNDVLQFALERDGRVQAGVRDLYGYIPLQYAVRIPASKTTDDMILSKLLQIFPDGAGCKDPLGRYPLHVALEMGHTWSRGVENLYRCYRASITERDRATDGISTRCQGGLYPFSIAALYSDLETTFCLLRENPEVLSFAIKTRL